MKNWLVCVKSQGSGCRCPDFLAIVTEVGMVTGLGEDYARVLYSGLHGEDRYSGIAFNDSIIPLWKLSEKEAKKFTPEQALQHAKGETKILPADKIRIINSILLQYSMFISTK